LGLDGNELGLPPIDALPEPIVRRYKRFTPEIYGLLGIPLAIAIIAFMYLLVASLMSIEENEEATSLLLPSALKLLLFGALYIIGSAIISYVMFDRLNHHLHYSVLESYIRAKKRGYNVRLLFRASLLKKNTPSPITALLLNLFLLGIPFPILLWYFEKTIREHSRLEEQLFTGRRVTSRIDAGNLLLDLLLTGVTLGLWLCYWCYRATKIYNEHIDRVHRGVVEQPSFTAVASIESNTIIPSMILLVTGVYTLLLIAGIPVYPMAVLSMASLYAYTVYRLRHMSFLKHTFILLGLEYTILACLGLIGFTGYSFYKALFEQVEESLPREHDLLSLTTAIFQNNLVITLAAIIPYIGVLYAGFALSNTGFVFGLILGTRYYSGEGLGSLQLFVMPHTFLELLAYALASAIAPRVFSQSVKTSVKQALLAVAVLFIAAVVESYTIILVKQG